LFAAASFASNLKDVRVGPHGEYTRVVLETDAKTSYSLSQSEDAVTIELQASSAPKAVAAKSQQLSWVRVQPEGASSRVRIELKGPARVKQMVLTGPHRIVLDVYADTAAARAAPSPAPAPAAPPAITTPEPGLDAEAALVEKEADALLGPAPGSVPGDEVAEAEALPSEAELAPEPELPAEPLAEPSAGPKPPAAAKVEVVRRKRGLFDWLGDPYILSGLAIVMVALAVILLRRRPAAKPAARPSEEEESAASLFAPSAGQVEESEAPEASYAGEESTADVVEGPGEPVESAEPADEESRSAFDFESPPVEPEKPEIGRARGATLSTIAAVTSTAGYEPQTPVATGGLDMAELERRLALLEQRLDEVIDAKDRLERQVSAQTEELRVQRAAIARTQRVLRTVVRPEDDQASEPVLKS
jgi:hypothetical protein